MDTEKQRRFLIQFLYYSIIIIFCIIFFRYAIYILMPFIIGFAIAYFLHPLIRFLSRNGHEHFYATLVILIFYSILGCILVWLSIKGFFYIRAWVLELPTFYDQYIDPYLHTSLSSVESVWKRIDINTASIFESITQSLHNSLSSFVSSISRQILSSLTNIMKSIPNIILAFFFAILSSFFMNADYNTITSLLRFLPKKIRISTIQTQDFLRTTCKQLFIAYTKIMMITFIELSIGLYLIGIEHAIWIALGIAIFDIIPIVGTGGVMIPWVLMTWLNQQPKLAVSLLILYLFITLIRNIIEPRIVGKQIGLHPLLMLLCMYLGGKFFGVLGIFILPLFILIVQNLYHCKE